jgi:hypothetical protein
MGRIRELDSEKSCLLEPEHVVGRRSTCALQLDRRYVSGQHAAVRWNGDGWDVRDLGSRNGTFLDGVRLRAGEQHPVPLGSRLAFGKLEHAWEMVDDSPPRVMAVPLDGGEPVFVDGDLLVLPSTDDPAVTIYPNTEGQWVLEEPQLITEIKNLQVFEVAHRKWRFACAEPQYRTSLADPLLELEVRHLELAFSVSKDEEHIHLRVVCAGRAFDLGARAHNYLLLILARRRIADVGEGLPETSCGWIYQEDFPHDPSMESGRLNLDVLRIRQQFSALGVVDAASIIERRPRTRQLRIGANRLSVVVL